MNCPNCQAEIPEGSRFCLSCGKPVTGQTPATGGGSLDINKLAHSLNDKLQGFVGGGKLEGFSLSGLFSQIFSKHKQEEIENYFSVGTQPTTPPIEAVNTAWPQPWLFFRALLGSVLVYVLFRLGWDEFENSNLIPGLIMVGCFAVPLATLLFFLEVNVRRNVSLYQVIRLVFLGGILSMILTCVLYSVLGDLIEVEIIGPLTIGFVEEAGKIGALIIVANIPKFKYKLNGLLFGAAIGTGFAAFESMGYALRIGIQANANEMMSNIVLRGLLAPFGHIVWTAMCGAALWRVKGANKFVFAYLKDVRFLRVFAVAVVLHGIWDMPFSFPFYLKFIILGIVAWLVVFGLIQDGLKELRIEKEQATHSVASEVTKA